MRRMAATVAVLAALLTAGVARGAAAAADEITDANVAAHVAAAQSKAQHLALAHYYRAKAAEAEARIPHFEQLFAAYMKREGKENESLQRQARQLLKGVRMTWKYYLQLAQAHEHVAWEQ
jgi:hypothetical protein